VKQALRPSTSICDSLFEARRTPHKGVAHYDAIINEFLGRRRSGGTGETGIDHRRGPPAALGTLIAADRAKWQALAQSVGITAE
jgi:hypothetical protein